ncbi:MAG: DUF6524 family protein [Pseudomonadota bacterium]
MGFLTRWLLALVLLGLTYNPTPYNYVQWVMDHGNQNLSIAVLTGLVLVVGYIIHLRATLRSIGVFGMTLVLAIAGSILWVAYDLGLFDPGNSNLNTWLGLIALSAVLGVGLNWSHVRRRVSGQADMDDVDE